MHIKQFENKNLSHFSYAILSDDKQVILIDPTRNPQPYLDYAKEQEAKIMGIIETHPHADFISGHLELHQLTGATVYTSKLVGAFYPHQTFDDGQTIEAGGLKLTALNTPGHSPDSISIVLEYDDKQQAVFTGDTLFIGDCGRPDLREGVGKLQASPLELARQMYHSLRDKLMVLTDDVLVYPAHGAGTLCGRNVSSETSSTMGFEKKTNWSLQQTTEEEFANSLVADQPFVPHYFSAAVEINRKGAAPLKVSLDQIKTGRILDGSLYQSLNKSLWIIDTRNKAAFNKGHFSNTANLMEEGKFETWLGSTIKPNEQFYLAGESAEQLQRMLERTASIGYEGQVAECFVIESGALKEEGINLNVFKKHKDAYTIVDVRNTPEVRDAAIFQNSISIPLLQLRNRINEIPTDKPIVVHCAGGLRGAAGSSIIRSSLGGDVEVFDLGEGVIMNRYLFY